MGLVNIYAVVWPPRDGGRYWTWQAWVNNRSVRTGYSRSKAIASVRGWVAVRGLQALYASEHVPSP